MSGVVEPTYMTAERKSQLTSKSFPIEPSGVAFHRLALLPVPHFGITAHSASRLQIRSWMYSLASCQTPGQIDGRVAIATAGVVVNGSPGVSQ